MLFKRRDVETQRDFKNYSGLMKEAAIPAHVKRPLKSMCRGLLGKFDRRLLPVKACLDALCINLKWGAGAHAPLPQGSLRGRAQRPLNERELL
jgi:hypothetical protein